jgi:hypothetical protein
METYTDPENKEAQQKELNLITYVAVEPAHESDAKALMPALESTQQRDLGPKEVLADTHYGGDENCCNAEHQYGVKVIAPTSGERKKETIPLSEFSISGEGTVVSCPQGHRPAWVKKKKHRHTAAFTYEHCSGCPHRQECGAKAGKKYYYLHYTDRALRVAMRRSYEQTDEFKERYRLRSGIEATMSQYDRRTGAKQLRVRGMKAVRFRATLKALSINILRAAAVVAVLISSPKYLFAVFSIIKERKRALWRCLKKLLSAITSHCVETSPSQPIYGC